MDYYNFKNGEEVTVTLTCEFEDMRLLLMYIVKKPNHICICISSVEDFKTVLLDTSMINFVTHFGLKY